VSKTTQTAGAAKFARPRTAARVAAVQALFQAELAGVTAESVIAEFLQYRLRGMPDAEAWQEGLIPMADAALFQRIVQEALSRLAELDGKIKPWLPADWPWHRLDPVLRALLRAAAAELAMTDGPPAKVVINEYLDVAHGFFQGDEPGLANAVLEQVARTLRPDEILPHPVQK